MKNPITIGFNNIRNKIFAGRSKEAHGIGGGVRVFVGEKFDVTSDACHAVAQHLISTGEMIEYTMQDGKKIILRADISA